MSDTRQRRFDALIGAFADDLFRYACWLSGDRHVAEDLTQNTLLRAWRFMDSLANSRAARQWLITTLRREHARMYQRKRFDYADIDVRTVAADQALRPDAQYEQERLRESLFTLPVAYREPLVLQALLGCSVREISGAMNLSENVVMTRLFRARRKLAERLGPSANTSQRARP